MPVSIEERRAAGRERYKANAQEWNRKKRETRLNDIEMHRERDRERAREMYKSQCPEARKKRNKANWAKNRESILAARREKRYGLNALEYEAMLVAQDHVCKICKMSEKGSRWKTLSVDHCHSTGLVRGLLCTECNLAVGVLEKHWENLESMRGYIEDARANAPSLQGIIRADRAKTGD